MNIQQLAKRHGFVIARVGLEAKQRRCKDLKTFKESFVVMYEDWMSEIEEFNEELSVTEIFDSSNHTRDDLFEEGFKLGQSNSHGCFIRCRKTNGSLTSQCIVTSLDENAFWHKAYEFYKRNDEFAHMIDGED